MKLVSSLDSLLVSGTDRSFVIDTLVSTLIITSFLRGVFSCRLDACSAVSCCRRIHKVGVSPYNGLFATLFLVVDIVFCKHGYTRDGGTSLLPYFTLCVVVLKRSHRVLVSSLARNSACLCDQLVCVDIYSVTHKTAIVLNRSSLVLYQKCAMSSLSCYT